MRRSPYILYLRIIKNVKYKFCRILFELLIRLSFNYTGCLRKRQFFMGQPVEYWVILILRNLLELKNVESKKCHIQVAQLKE